MQTTCERLLYIEDCRFFFLDLIRTSSLHFHNLFLDSLSDSLLRETEASVSQQMGFLNCYKLGNGAFPLILHFKHHCIAVIV